MVSELTEHTQLAVRLKAGEHSAGMMVIKELAAELEIKFITKLRNPVLDMAGLDFHILIVVKSVFHNGTQKYIKYATFAA